MHGEIKKGAAHIINLICQHVHSYVHGSVPVAMAWRRRRDVGEAFRTDPQLLQFVLTDVTPTGKVLGTGSYGSVEEVSWHGTLYVATKRL